MLFVLQSEIIVLHINLIAIVSKLISFSFRTEVTKIAQSRSRWQHLAGLNKAKQDWE